ncbi:MAG: tetratricopeptide repeat protein, partial [Bryobacteraceae bacterium]
VLLTAGESKLARECLERAATNRSFARLDLAVAIYQMEGAPAALKVLDALPPNELTGDALLLKASILELAGRRAEAEKVLDEGLRHASMKPRVIEQAVLLLVRLEREAEGLNLLEQAIRSHPQSDLLLLKAIVLAFMDRSAAAEKALQDVELRWPEWDRAYLVHGLVSESSGRMKEARQKLQTAAALGSKDPALTCALDRLSGNAASAPECTCSKGLEQLLFKRCTR